jgi:PAS domain S-box-containing protein
MMKTIVESYEQHAARRTADDEPAELPQALEILLQARTADAVFVVDTDYRIVYWDAKAESLTGLLAEETIGKPCHEVLKGECGGGSRFCDSQCPVMRLARAGRTAPANDMRISTRWGQKKWVGVSNLSVETEEGTYLVHLLRDTQKIHETLEMAHGLIELSTQDALGESPVLCHRDTPVLTPRQFEVLELLASGKSTREICRELYLSQATVRNHIRALLLALGAHSQLEALAKARQAGLLMGG